MYNYIGVSEMIIFTCGTHRSRNTWNDGEGGMGDSTHSEIFLKNGFFKLLFTF